MSGFLCKGKFNKQLVSWLQIKNAWLPAIAVCTHKLFKEEIPPNPLAVPIVENFEFAVDGKMTTQTWTPNETYWTWAEVQVNGGLWEPLGTEGPNSSSGSFYFSGLNPEDDIGFRLRFGDYGGTKFGPWTEQFGTIGNTKIFHAPLSLENADSFINGATAVEGQSVNFFVEQGYITIDHPENLYQLYISEQGLVGDLDLTRCDQLDRLYCNDNNVSEEQGIFSINVNGLTQLTRLRATGMPMLENVNISGCTSLNQLRLSYAGIANLDISGTNMNFLNLNNCENLVSLTATGVVGSAGKAYFTIFGCNLDAEAINAFFTSLGVMSGYKGIIEIGENPGSKNCNPTIATNKEWIIGGGPIRIFTGTAPINLSDFQITGDVSLMHYGNDLYIDDPDLLTGFNLAESTAAGELNLYNCDYLTSVNLYSATGLTLVRTTNSNIVDNLDVRYCSSLVELNVDSNEILGSLNFLGCSSLEIFSANNALALTIENVPSSIVELSLENQGQDGTLSLYGCESLVTLYAPSCHMDNIDFTGCVNLSNVNLNNCIYLTDLYMNDSSESLNNLDAANTGINSLSLSNFTSLTNCSLRDNSILTSISVTNCPLLFLFTSYSCTNLTSLDVSNNNGLTHVYAHNCQNMTSINIANDPSLQLVNVATNGLDAAAIDSMFTQLPTYPGVVYIYNNPGTGTCDTTIATGKNWSFG